MEIRLRSVEPGLILLACRGVISHPVNGHNNDPLRALLPEPNWQGNVLLDLHQAEYIGTEGIGWLVHWQRQLEKAGGCLGLFAVSPRVNDMFRLCRLHLFIPMWETEAEARAALAARPAPKRPESRTRARQAAPGMLAPEEEEVSPACQPEPALPVGPAGPTDRERVLLRILPQTDEEANREEPKEKVEVKKEGTKESSAGLTQEKGTLVLVVDDTAVERRRAGSALETWHGLGINGPVYVVYASNGLDALKKIQETPPDLVVTDLVMPDLDGLGLVKEVRANHPTIPVILMTAHGSEEIAAAALQAGAASYVPKRYLARDLGDTVDTILRLAQANRRQQVILEHLVEAESRFLLPSDLALIVPLVEYLQSNLKYSGVCGGNLHVPIALHEALSNAITHGNLEASNELREADHSAWLLCLKERPTRTPYSNRRVFVQVRETREEVGFVIRDEGPGFDTTSLPEPTDPENLQKASGRGLFLIRSFMDEVRFNDAGNEITMIKRRM